MPATNLTSDTTNTVSTLTLAPDGVYLLDQTALPLEVRYAKVVTAPEMAHAIRTMIVRGAPAIGIAGAYGVVLSARLHQAQEQDFSRLLELIRADIRLLQESRPTAVNLEWALRQMEAELAEVATG
jgi:methylthioribose-1-phosphate isomerase